MAKIYARSPVNAFLVKELTWFTCIINTDSVTKVYTIQISCSNLPDTKCRPQTRVLGYFSGPRSHLCIRASLNLALSCSNCAHLCCSSSISFIWCASDLTKLSTSFIVAKYCMHVCESVAVVLTAADSLSYSECMCTWCSCHGTNLLSLCSSLIFFPLNSSVIMVS